MYSTQLTLDNTSKMYAYMYMYISITVDTHLRIFLSGGLLSPSSMLKTLDIGEKMKYIKSNKLCTDYQYVHVHVLVPLRQ